MAEIIDFKTEKKRIYKELKNHIDAEIKSQDWYIEAQHKLKLRFDFIKILFLVDIALIALVYFII